MSSRHWCLVAFFVFGCAAWLAADSRPAQAQSPAQCITLVGDSGPVMMKNTCGQTLSVSYCIDNPRFLRFACRQADGSVLPSFAADRLAPGQAEEVHPLYASYGGGKVHWAVCVAPSFVTDWEGGTSRYNCYGQTATNKDGSVAPRRTAPGVDPLAAAFHEQQANTAMQTVFRQQVEQDRQREAEARRRDDEAHQRALARINDDEDEDEDYDDDDDEEEDDSPTVVRRPAQSEFGNVLNQVIRAGQARQQQDAVRRQNEAAARQRQIQVQQQQQRRSQPAPSSVGRVPHHCDNKAYGTCGTQ